MRFISTISVTLFVIIYFVSSYKIYGQVSLSIQDPLDYGVVKQMEYQFSKVFNHLNRAYSNGQKPTWNNHNDINMSFKQSIDDIWRYTSIRLDEDTLIRPAYTLSSGNYEVRDIPISLVNPDTIIFEEAALIYNANGKLINFLIGLPQHKWMHYLYEATEEIDRSRRQTILNFVEQYRTAYNTRNISLIKQVFSEQALIVVGNVVTVYNELTEYSKYQYLKLTKQEYIARLDDIFKKNEFVNLNFDDISILRHPKHPSVYGVMFVQNFRSTYYSDDGYVFLLIDFRKDEYNPIIHVRTWQPVKGTPKERIFQLGDIEIY